MDQRETVAAPVQRACDPRDFFGIPDVVLVGDEDQVAAGEGERACAFAC